MCLQGLNNDRRYGPQNEGVRRSITVDGRAWDIVIDPFPADLRLHHELFAEKLRSCDGYLLVFSLLSSSSLDYMINWHKWVDTLPKRTLLAVVGTKADSLGRDESGRRAGLLARNLKCRLVETSIFDDGSIDDLLSGCVRIHVATKASAASRSSLLAALDPQLENSTEVWQASGGEHGTGSTRKRGDDSRRDHEAGPKRPGLWARTWAALESL